MKCFLGVPHSPTDMQAGLSYVKIWSLSEPPDYEDHSNYIIEEVDKKFALSVYVVVGGLLQAGQRLTDQIKLMESS